MSMKMQMHRPAFTEKVYACICSVPLGIWESEKWDQHMPKMAILATWKLRSAFQGCKNFFENK